MSDSLLEVSTSKRCLAKLRIAKLINGILDRASTNPSILNGFVIGEKRVLLLSLLEDQIAILQRKLTRSQKSN